MNNNIMNNYNKWLNKNINGSIDENIHKNNNIKNDYNQNLKEINLDYVKYFYFNIKNIIEKNKINITNEKEFREEIGIFIYRNSR